jgi:uncharacterized membrane protein
VLGGFLALLSAATFAFETATARRGVLTGSVAQALSITVPLGVPIFFLVAAAVGSLGAILDFSTLAIFYLALAGVLHFVWGRYCNYRASKAMGANLVAPVQQSNMLVTLALAIWILGEHLTPLRVLGIVLVVLGQALTYDRSRHKASAAIVGAPIEIDATSVPAELRRAICSRCCLDRLRHQSGAGAAGAGRPGLDRACSGAVLTPPRRSPSR